MGAILTLIVGSLAGNWVSQATDRLVTEQRPSGQIDPFDDRSNKNVLYVTPAAFLSFAYTGLAFIQGKPTDQWLAELLNGEPFPRGVHGGVALMRAASPPRELPHAAAAVQRIADAVTVAFAARPHLGWQEEPLEVVCAGWQRLDGNAHRIFVSIKKGRGRVPVEVKWIGERKLGRRRLLYAAPASNITREEGERWLCEQRTPDHDEAEARLVAAIRSVADKPNAAVGRDVTAILILRPSQGLIRVRYHGAAPHMVRVSRGSWETVLRTWYSPWIVAPGGHFAAAEHSGGSNVFNTGLCEVHLEEVSHAVEGLASGVGFSRTALRRGQR